MRSYFAMCIATLGISSGTYAAEIKVLSDGPLRPALTQIAEAFERDSGHQMKVEFGLSPVIHKKVIDGEPADVIIIQPNFIEELVTAGKLAAGEHPIIARVGIGLMVRAGTDAPDISTADLLKQALLAADSIVFSNVASGNAFAKVLEQLGIAETVKDKVTRTTPADVIVRIIQGKGRDIGVGTTTLIRADQRLKLAGPLPGGLQSYLVYAAASTIAGQQSEPAKALIRFLASPAARTQFAAADAY
jgi:molybdate transport system substrate-binding protein